MAIHIERISKIYGQQTVLHEFSAEIPEPGVSCLMGKSGIGKTTLLHILLGIQQPDSGEISGLTGRTMTAVFQEDRLLPWCTALENVALVLESSDKPANNEKAATMLQRLGIGAAMLQLTTELSGGMLRRVALARAMVVEPDILVLDEPFKGLDAELKLSIMEMIKAFSREKTVILVTHDPKEADFFEAKVVQLMQTGENNASKELE